MSPGAKTVLGAAQLSRFVHYRLCVFPLPDGRRWMSLGEECARNGWEPTLPTWRHFIGCITFVGTRLHRVPYVAYRWVARCVAR